MAIRRYLAMTAAEIRANSAISPGIAWMACHFSPYGTGLSNLPCQLPPDSALILDDITPIHGHDPEQIANQLEQCAGALECRGVVLDFQRPGSKETAALAKYLSEALSYPVGVSEPYARGLQCPVFLPPVPLDVPLADYLKPWQGREIWLEMALDGQIITLTEQGAETAPLPFGECPEGGFSEAQLHCHYLADVTQEQVTFTLWRTAEDLEAMLHEAENLSVTTTVGLYQEFPNWIIGEGQ